VCGRVSDGGVGVARRTSSGSRVGQRVRPHRGGGGRRRRAGRRAGAGAQGGGRGAGRAVGDCRVALGDGEGLSLGLGGGGRQVGLGRDERGASGEEGEDDALELHFDVGYMGILFKKY
jgi:hypothetical protein